MIVKSVLANGVHYKDILLLYWRYMLDQKVLIKNRWYINYKCVFFLKIENALKAPIKKVQVANFLLMYFILLICRGKK